MTDFKQGDRVVIDAHAPYPREATFIRDAGPSVTGGTICVVAPTEGWSEMNVNSSRITPALTPAPTTFKKGDTVARLNYFGQGANRYLVIGFRKDGDVRLEHMGNHQRTAAQPEHLELIQRQKSKKQILRDNLDAARKELEDARAAADLLQREQRAAQYHSDAALLKAGLVRVELLAQWDAKFTPRPGRTEKSLALLSELRATIQNAMARTR